jgi:hypothetical protein
VLTVYYDFHNVQRHELRMLISTLALAGYVCVVVLPSADLLLRVLGTHYHALFG